jgi:hypothetical protein
MILKSCWTSRSVRDAVGSSGYVELDAQGAQPLARLGAHGVLIEGPPAGAWPATADEQVLGDRELGEEVELLRYHGDACRLRVARCGELDNLAVDLERPLVGGIETVNDLH